MTVWTTYKDREGALVNSMGTSQAEKELICSWEFHKGAVEQDLQWIVSADGGHVKGYIGGGKWMYFF
jgi:hypothetical protein